MRRSEAPPFRSRSEPAIKQEEKISKRGVTPRVPGVRVRCFCVLLPTCATPSSHPLMTWPWPMVKVKGRFLSRDESNLEPSARVPGERGGGRGQH